MPKRAGGFSLPPETIPDLKNSPGELPRRVHIFGTVAYAPGHANSIQSPFGHELRGEVAMKVSLQTKTARTTGCFLFGNPVGAMAFEPPYLFSGGSTALIGLQGTNPALTTANSSFVEARTENRLRFGSSFDLGESDRWSRLAPAFNGLSHP